MSDILKLHPGHELDELVAVKVMGAPNENIFFTHWGNGPFIYDLDGNEIRWKPSTDLTAAWEVVEWMKELNWWFVLSSEVESWTAMFYWDLTQTEFEAKETTAPHAICLAALLALEGNRGG